MSDAMQSRRAGRPTNAERDARAAAEHSRADTVAGERRSRRGGALDVGAQLKMSLPPAWYERGGMLDSEAWVSRWVNDDGNNVWMLTNRDDYDFVELPEGVEAAALGIQVDQRADGASRISMPVGRKQDGGEMRAYLMRKPKDFWSQHQAEILSLTAKQERARLTGEDTSGHNGGLTDGSVYTPAGNSLRRETVTVDYQP